MPSLDRRLTKLEEAFEKHMVESGEIRADLKWLKRSFWALAGLGTLITTGVIGEILHRIWR